MILSKYIVDKGLMSLIHFLKNILLHQQEKEEYLIEKKSEKGTKRQITKEK